MAEKKIKHWHLVFLAAIFLIFLGLRLYGFYWPKANLKLKDQTLTVLVANNNAHRFKGLGGRKDLGNYDGMLFIYEQKRQAGIVMRDMLFPIDVVWFAGGRVVDIAVRLSLEPGVTEEQLTHYYPRVEADLILELPAGWAEKNGLKIGDQLKVIN